MEGPRYAVHPRDRDLVDQIRQALWALLKRRDLASSDYVEVAALIAALDHFPDVIDDFSVCLDLTSSTGDPPDTVSLSLDDESLRLERSGPREDEPTVALSISTTERETDYGDDDSDEDPIDAWLDRFLRLLKDETTAIQAYCFGNPSALNTTPAPRPGRWAGVVDPETGEGFFDEPDPEPWDDEDRYE